MKFHKDGIAPHNGSNIVFVFGSNTAGRHGAGAAKAAYRFYGAVYGNGFGRMRDSYAIPTLDNNLEQLSLAEINSNVQQFKAYVLLHPEEEFFITRIGCALAGYKNEDIAPMFKDFPENCSFAEEWEPWLV